MLLWIVDLDQDPVSSRILLGPYSCTRTHTTAAVRELSTVSVEACMYFLWLQLADACCCARCMNLSMFPMIQKNTTETQCLYRKTGPERASVFENDCRIPPCSFSEKCFVECWCALSWGWLYIHTAQRFVQAPNRTQRAPFQNCYWFSVNRKYFIISCICAQKQYVDFRS